MAVNSMGLIDGFLDEIDGAGLHGLDGGRNIAMAGQDDDRQSIASSLIRASSSRPSIPGIRRSSNMHPTDAEQPRGSQPRFRR